MLWIVTGAFGTFLLFLITLSIQDQRFEARTILAQGITVPATVIAVPAGLPQNDPDGTRRPYQIRVRFTDADGKVQEQVAWQFLNKIEYNRLETGDSVEVVYLPHRTYTPYLKAPLERVAGSGWVAVLTGMGAFTALAAMLWGFFLKAAPEPLRPDNDSTLPSSN